MTTARRAVVRGRVQGVGFRWSAHAEAERIGVGGWVKNLPDGSVEALVQGAPEDVEAMLAWLRSGPGHARVDSCTERDAVPERGLTRFEIRR